MQQQKLHNKEVHMRKQNCSYDYVYELDRLAKAQASANNLFAPWPDGVRLSVRHRKTNGNIYTYVYKRFTDAEGKEHVAYQKEEDLAGETNLIGIFCAEKVLRKLKELRKTLQTEPASYDPFELQKLYEDFYSAFAIHTPKEFQPNSILTRHWLSQPIPRNYYPEKLVQPTNRGDLVRSKYEQSMANILYELKIPYLYEKPKLINGTPYLPDFTLIDPQNGSKVYIEAFGMMDDPEYCMQSIKKIHAYEAAGYVQGKDFFMVFDAPESPFDPAAFRRMMLWRFY